MNFFLSSIDFSFINEQILGTISTRLNLPLCDEVENKKEEEQSLFLNIMACGFYNSFSMINDKEIKISSNLAFIISPIIKKNLQTDITCSSFIIDLNSHFKSFEEFYKSIFYFHQSEENYVFDQKEFENEFLSQLTKMIKNMEIIGINSCISFINEFFKTEKSAFDYSILISIFMKSLNI